MTPDSKGPIKDLLQAHREWILSGEFCSLFHDLGKLSSLFIQYRQTWYSQDDGYSKKDPHEHEFLAKHDPLAQRYPQLIRDLTCDRSFVCPRETVNLGSVMSSHARELDTLQPIYERALKIGDSLDSAHQRNNPLFSGEQTPRSGDPGRDLRQPVFRSDVFGYESADVPLIPSSLDEMREALYRRLEANPAWRSWWTGVADAKSRMSCLQAVQEAFACGLGDTTRPVNDTSLWEHTYSVASLTKAIQAAYAIYGDAAFEVVRKRPNPPLLMWGLGWDPIRFIGRGQRLWDLEARREVMRQARDKVRNLIEFDWALGNTVYEDDGAMVFVVPGSAAIDKNDATLPDPDKEYSQFIHLREAEIIQIFAEVTGCELCPRFSTELAYRDGAPDLTKVVDLLADIRVPGSARVPAVFFKKAPDLSTGSKDLENVCPICRIRQIRKNELASRKEKACDVCLGRRVKTAQDHRKMQIRHKEENRHSAPETPFLSEISDGNGRLAMVVARFGLDDWLNGEMVRTTFVTEANGLERELALMLSIPSKEFESQEENAVASIGAFYCLTFGEYDFPRIQREIQAACLNSSGEFVNDRLAKATYFLYGRRKFEPNPSDAWPSNEVNPKIAKTPTASRLLNAWKTTESFFKSWASEANDEGHCRIHDTVRHRERMVYPVESLPDGCREFQPYTGTANGQPIEFTVDRSGRNSVSIVRGRIEAAGSIRDIRTSEGSPVAGEIAVSTERGNPEPFSPFRVVLATPELFLILVPSEFALPVVEALHREFEKRFGKVIGRLPFSIGSVFFQEQQPMFIVLDAARRMLSNFAKLQRRSRRSGIHRQEWQVSKSSDGGGCIDFTNGYSWKVAPKLGDKKDDFYHPYLLVENCNATRKSYQETPMGNVVHCSEVVVGDIIHPPASDFDFEFLDSSAARFRISLGEDERRANRVLNGALTRPIPLEALRADMTTTWELLRSRGLTNSSLRDMLAVLIAKLEEWQIKLPLPDVRKAGEPAYEWAQVAEQQIAHRLPKLTMEERELVLKQIVSGTFFETAFLHLHILKQGLENGD